MLQITKQKMFQIKTSKSDDSAIRIAPKQHYGLIIFAILQQAW